MNKTPKIVKKPAATGEKTCAVTRQVLSRRDMLRFVVAPDGKLFFDAACKLPGRGIWLVPDQNVLKEAIQKRVFQKNAHQLAHIPNDIIDIVTEQLKKQTMSLLGLCRKAGVLGIGFEGTKEIVTAGQCRIAFENPDASAREHERLFRPDDSFFVCRALSRDELGAALGIGACVYVAATQSALADELHDAARKLTYFLDTTGNKKG